MLFIMTGFIPSNIQAQEKSLPQYQIKKTRKPIVVDGNIDVREWRKAPWTKDFSDITGDVQKVPRFRTHAKMLWDDENLYIAVEIEEPYLWATLLKRDDIIYRDHDIEVFIDPGADQTNYFEIEMNALNTVMDLFMNKPYKKGGNYDMNWNAEGMKTAVGLKGSLNEHHDVDTGWTLEMKIPFKALKKEGRVFQPTKGSKWRLNFSRVEWTIEMKDGNYAVKKDQRGKKIPEDNWVWSPIGEINMHIPEHWGFIIFK